MNKRFMLLLPLLAAVPWLTQAHADDQLSIVNSQATDIAGLALIAIVVACGLWLKRGK